MDQERSKEIHSKIRLMRYVGVLLLTLTSILLRLVTFSKQKSLFCPTDKRDFIEWCVPCGTWSTLRAWCGFACDARLRRVCGTHRITYHSAAASLITYLQAIYHWKAYWKYWKYCISAAVNEINPCGICGMHFMREEMLRIVKCLRQALAEKRG